MSEEVGPCGAGPVVAASGGGSPEKLEVARLEAEILEGIARVGSVGLSGVRENVRRLAEMASRPLPPLEELVMPRNEAGLTADPILDVLSAASRPWELASVAGALRQAGVDVPRKAEAELAAALYYTLRMALEHGAEWRAAVIADLSARIAEKKEMAGG